MEQRLAERRQVSFETRTVDNPDDGIVKGLSLSPLPQCDRRVLELDNGGGWIVYWRCSIENIPLGTIARSGS